MTTRNYLVIHDNSQPHEEYTEWKVVLNCVDPADALARSGFKPPRRHPEHDVVTVFALDPGDLPRVQCQRFEARKNEPVQPECAWVAKEPT